ncbi:hypothetical protein AV274_2434 [Blastocystis sp. ATCC 50177/Nand II]|uniref:Uncharacterized protein n=1 Tax=Blastocystis sp. subtype 1 (strain ATCC 50177 / NandII) TaxID=478820 RepID=A0A196SI52_BLAHN|nr:hypothetical protein AV274_2434 [Blastocystis sp. ATCC 50177/Nand II]
MLSSKLICIGKHALRSTSSVHFASIGALRVHPFSECVRPFASSAKTAQKGNEEEEPTKMRVKRNEKEEGMVKQYMQLIDMCNYRKYYFAERTKALQYSNILLTPGELSSAVNYMYRLGLNRMILQTYNYYERSKALALFNTVSVKYAMLSAAQLKDSEKVHTIYNSIMQYRTNNLILRSTYVRCLLSLREVKEASALIEEIKTSSQYRNRNVTSTNDLYTNAILGFYEGESYSHCLQLFKSIRPAGEYMPDTHSPEWKQIQNSKCYSSVIGSCFRLGDFAATQYFYHESRKMGVFPNYRESLMVAESFIRTGAGEKRLEELRHDASACKGIPEGEKERYLRSKSSVEEWRKAIRQVFLAWHFNTPHRPKFDPRSSSICLYQESNGDVANSLCFVAGLYDVAHFSNRDLANCKLVVKLGANQKGLTQIVDFLEKDIYPILPYTQEDNRIVVYVPDVQQWINTRKLLDLALK